MARQLKLLLGRVENIVEKGENAGYQHFLLFPKCLRKTSFSRQLKVEIVCPYLILTLSQKSPVCSTKLSKTPW